MLRIYFATSMTGRTGSELLAQFSEAAEAQELLSLLGGELFLSAMLPRLGDEPDVQVFIGKENPDDKLRSYWKRDKEMIRYAHVLVDLTGPRKSAGVEHEVGYARYFLYKPVIRVWPGMAGSVARIEDDVIVPTAAHALVEANRLWGTPWKRLKWRLAMTNRCILGYFANQIREWRNLV